MTDSERQQLKAAIQHLADTHLWDKNQFVLCSVDSVNESDQTCDCTPIGGNATTSIPAVKLTAEQNDGFLLIPAIGSNVVVTYSVRNEPYITLFSDIDKCILIAQKLVQFQDGSFGGLVKVAELTDKINKLENDLNVLKQAFTAWAVVPNDGGAALKTITSTWSGQTIPVTSKSEIENTKITHGK